MMMVAECANCYWAGGSPFPSIVETLAGQHEQTFGHVTLIHDPENEVPC